MSLKPYNPEESIFTISKYSHMMNLVIDRVAAFSPFATMFLKALIYRVVKTQDCLVES